jgi:hypothetical protein
LYDFAIFHSFPRWSNLEESFLLHDCGNLFFAIAQVDLRRFPEALQFIQPDLGQILLFEPEHQNCALTNLYGDQRPSATARAFSSTRESAFEDPAAQIRIARSPHRTPQIVVVDSETASESHKWL